MLRNLGGAALAGISGSILVALLTGLSGPIGLAIVAYVLFVVTYAVLVSLTEDRPAVTDAVMTVVMASSAVLAIGALAVVIFFTLARGWVPSSTSTRTPRTCRAPVRPPRSPGVASGTPSWGRSG